MVYLYFMLSTGTLFHGGIIVNYFCNAACRHCLYACSPARDSSYISEEMAEKICESLLKGGCRSVHIGGGEPFINLDGLIMMIRALKRNGITLEYTETNAYWAADIYSQQSFLQDAREILQILLAEGADTLCISVDPFHAEYVPYGAPLALAKLCEKTGMNYFLWRQESLYDLSKLDSQKIHSRADMEKILSAGYIYKAARQYGTTYGGRAVNIEREFAGHFPAENFTGKKTPCRNLLSTGHFHVDLNGYFIPPGCTGIRIPLTEAIAGIQKGKYPVFEALYDGGISGLMEFALKHGFSAENAEPKNQGYPSKCNLCFYIRKFLSEKDFVELDKEHYRQALKFY